MAKPILCLDFDGVIHSYSSGWKGAGNIPEPPVPGVGVYLLRAVLYHRVAIFSSRSRSLRGRRAMKRYVRQLLWDACLEDTSAGEEAWSAVGGKPPEWIPWTTYDVRDQAHQIGKSIMWPWFKPSATITIDDRALTFSGNWADPAYQPEALAAFQPWNK